MEHVLRNHLYFSSRLTQALYLRVALGKGIRDAFLAHFTQRRPLLRRWPFGKGVRDAFLPTSVEELRNHEAAVIELENRAKRSYGVQYGRDVV